MNTSINSYKFKNSDINSIESTINNCNSEVTALINKLHNPINNSNRYSNADLVYNTATISNLIHQATVTYRKYI